MKIQAPERLPQLAGAYTEDRLTREEAKALALQLKPIIRRHCQGFQIAGSFRRMNASIGDLDFVVVNCDTAGLLLALVQLMHAEKAPRAGKDVMTVIIPFKRKHIQVEFVNVKPRALGSGLLHSTGGADFNKGLRSFAKSKGMLLSQHGLFRVDNGQFLAGRTEEDVFKKLGWEFVPPKERGQSFLTLKGKYCTAPYKNNLLLKEPKGEGKVWKVKSKSNPDKMYFVTLHSDGKMTCTCPQFVYRKVDCKHIDFIKEKKNLASVVSSVDAPPISPHNVDGRYKIGELLVDNENGLGNIPETQNVMYMGFVAFMTPKLFFRLAAPSTDKFARSKDMEPLALQKGIASPLLFLSVENDNAPWGLIRVVGHEGRARMSLIERYTGDHHVPVQIHVKYIRAHRLDMEFFKDFKSGTCAENMKTITMPVPVKKIFWRGEEIVLD